MIDNLGFAVDNLLKNNDCAIKIPLEWKMLRVAKYLQRMVDALLLAKINNPIMGVSHNNDASEPKSKKCLEEIYDLCGELNKIRKQGNYSVVAVSKKFKVVMDKIRTNNTKNLTEDVIIDILVTPVFKNNGTLHFSLHIFKCIVI